MGQSSTTKQHIITQVTTNYEKRQERNIAQVRIDKVTKTDLKITP